MVLSRCGAFMLMAKQKIMGTCIMTRVRLLSPYLIGLRLLARNCERHSRGIRSHVAGICDFLKHVKKKKKKIARQIFSQNSHRVVTGVSNPSQFSLRESESARYVRQLCSGGSRGGSGGSNEPPHEPKLFHFHGEFQEKLVKLHKLNPPQLIWTPDPNILDPPLLCEGLATYETKLWLIGDIVVSSSSHSSLALSSSLAPPSSLAPFSILTHNCHSTVARHSRDRRATVASAQNSQFCRANHRASVVRLSRMCHAIFALHVCELQANFGPNFARSSCGICKCVVNTKLEIQCLNCR